MDFRRANQAFASAKRITDLTARQGIVLATVQGGDVNNGDGALTGPNNSVMELTTPHGDISTRTAKVKFKTN